MAPPGRAVLHPRLVLEQESGIAAERANPPRDKPGRMR
jgi:hypothetical protein